MKRALAALPTWAMFTILIFPFVFANIIPFGVPIANSVLVLWLFVTGRALRHSVTAFINISFYWFNASLAYVFSYGFFIEIVFGNTLPKFALPFHLLAVLGIFSALFFVSKLLVISEDKKIVKANRCFGTFLLLWFFPVGIWFIHPRIKKVLNACRLG
jgi:hypothetical protein